MLISLEFENWTSFKGNHELNCLATYEQRHKGRCPYVNKFKETYLPVIMLVGGNAAGKSNLLSIFSFLKNLVLSPLDNEELIPVQPYLLQESNGNEVVSFKLELLIDELIYRLEIELNKNEILTEKLFLENSNSIYPLYERNRDKIDLKTKCEKNSALKTIAKGTRKNRLFLTNCIDQQDETFANVYNWFTRLTVINPDEIFLLPRNLANDLEDISERFMPKLDTGIKRIEFREVAEEKLSIPGDFLEDVKKKVTDRNRIAFVQNAKGTEQILVRYMMDGSLQFKKVVAIHDSMDGEHALELKYESEGTRRVINLLPKFYELMNNREGVLIIDELDRSLHTQLTRALIEAYLETCTKDKRTQLIFSTHDMMLMDQELLRRDEMWLVERNLKNESEVYSIADFEEVRHDTDIRKLYLNGRFGGNPKISSIF